MRSRADPQRPMSNAMIVAFLGLGLGLLPIFLFCGYWSWSHPRPVTGKTRLVRDGDRFYIEAQYRVLYFFRRWKELGYWRSLALLPETERDSLSPKVKGRWGSHRTAYFDTPEQAREAAQKWSIGRKVQKKTHRYDGPKEFLTV